MFYMGFLSIEVNTMIYNIRKLDEKDREFLIGYFDLIRKNGNAESIQDQYYTALKVSLDLLDDVPNISWEDIKAVPIHKHLMYLEFIMEYFIVVGKSLYDIVGELDLSYLNIEWLSKIYYEIDYKLKNEDDRILLLYQYIGGLGYLADSIMVEELSERHSKLTDLYNSYIDREIELMEQISELEGKLFDMKSELKRTEMLSEEISAKSDRALTRLGRFYEEEEGIDVSEMLEEWNYVKVKVFATMSAGKSTFINALLQQKLMPSSNMACTAKVTKVFDNNEDAFEVQTFTKDKVALLSQSDVTYDDMKILNAESEVGYIKAYGNIPFNDSDEIELEIIDTPGPNNSRDGNHVKLMEEELENLDSDTIIIYIINATQFGIDDDAKLLDKLYNATGYGDKRILFLVNKVDQFDPQEEDLSGLLSDVEKYLEQHNFYDPKIFPVSSLLALDVRALLQTPYVDDDDDDVYEVKGMVRKVNRNNDLHLEKYANVSEEVANRVNLELEIAEESGDKCEMALIHSGIRNVEETILEMAEKITDDKLSNDFWQ